MYAGQNNMTDLLETAILGDDIPELITALLLCRAGCKVHIIDQYYHDSHSSPGCILLSPSVAKQLQQIVAEDELASLSTRVAASLCIEPTMTGQPRERILSVLDELGGDIRIIQVQALHHLLRRLVAGEGAVFHREATICSIDADSSSLPLVTLSTGGRFVANFIIVTDKFHKEQAALSESHGDSHSHHTACEVLHPHQFVLTTSVDYAQGIEDAITLGTLLRNATSLEQIPIFTQAFGEIVDSRHQHLREVGSLPIQLPFLPSNPNLNSEKTPAADVVLTEPQLQFLASVIGYDPHEAAEEWWTSWGRYTQRKSDRPPFRLLDLVQDTDQCSISS
ncbi:hypothetical protein C8Q75DRAFT_803205 [Abortiporus biennis]|nr:hypothetical protein C8Q75DRAFT_803205 [Abortiporus biennis]